MAPAIAVGAAQCEVRDVDPMISEDCAHATDHARYVLVADHQHRALQRSLDINAIKAQQARRRPVQNCSARGYITRLRMDRELEHIARATRCRRRLLLEDSDTALLCDGCRIDAVHSLGM